MNVKTTNLKGEVTIEFSGRWDTSCCRQVSEDIERQLAETGEVASLTCDMLDVNYISSSGLRILLRLAQRYRNFRVTEAQPQVYDVLDMTGFTKIMPVEKALRRLSIEGCEEIGRGGVGIVYRIDEDTIIKVFREGTTLDEVRTEITMSKQAFVLGMPTAISFDIVRVGSQYGLVYELLHAEMLSTCLRNDPERIDELARSYASLFHQLHSIEVPADSGIPSVLKRLDWAIRHIARYFDTASIDLMLRMASCFPEGNRLLHCDLQMKNVMMQDGELMLIDMGEVGCGHPVVDLGYAYSSMVTNTTDYELFFGMPRALGSRLYMKMLDYYIGSDMSQAEHDHRLKQIEAVSCIRNFTWLSLSDSFPEESIRECQEIFVERVWRRKDYLLDVCSTLKDWEI